MVRCPTAADTLTKDDAAQPYPVNKAKRLAIGRVDQAVDKAIQLSFSKRRLTQLVPVVRNYRFILG